MTKNIAQIAQYALMLNDKNINILDSMEHCATLITRLQTLDNSYRLNCPISKFEEISNITKDFDDLIKPYLDIVAQYQKIVDTMTPIALTYALSREIGETEVTKKIFIELSHIEKQLNQIDATVSRCYIVDEFYIACLSSSKMGGMDNFYGDDDILSYHDEF